MVVCPACGEENPERFRLCGFCGTPLAAPIQARELRRTVTIVFSDLKGSTTLGERLDSESLREVMARYFEEMRAALERHGGRVEKYIGDAIMAVFGLPNAHEDDALRAVRAAIEMKVALSVVNEELERRWGVVLQNRTGVNTGEVVAADSADAQRLVTGDAVNVAARLEQAAPALEILMGEPTYRLVRHAVEVEAVEPLELKGKSEPVQAYRLIGVRADGEGIFRNRQATLVGREEELALLEEAFALACERRRAQLVTLIGAAGIGKSRLAEEFLSRIRGPAITLRGRALAYGDGITLWPLVEVVRQAAGFTDRERADEARERLAALVPGRDDLVERIASAIGLSDQTFSMQELFWAVRELLELLAARQPLVVALEDLHWAEPTFLDLIEHLGDNLRAPVLLLCDSRPELLETRSTWQDRPDGVVVSLAPLTESQSARVIANTLGDVGLDARVREQVVAAAGGNPLFAEQLLSMLIDDGQIEILAGRWRARGDLAGLKIPPTIHSLLAARIDRLSREERAVLDAAAVIGNIFPSDAVRELAPEAVGEQIGGHLESLTRRQLVRPAGTEAGYEEAYRFEHVLIRDTAYDALLKRTRAELHERFSTWAERVNQERQRETEFEEILGYHLEQAYNYLADLGPIDEHGRELGDRGSRKLAGAGRRAFQRGDMAAAANLLERSAALLAPGARDRYDLLPMLAEARMEVGEFARAEALLAEIPEAALAGDIRLSSRARLTALLVRHYVVEDLAAWRADVLAETELLIPLLEEVDAHAELASAWRLIGGVHAMVCRWGEQVDAVQRALEHARLAGDRRLEARIAGGYANGLRDGPTPVEEAIERCTEILERDMQDRQAEALVRCSLAYLLALQGDLESARRQYARGQRLFDDLGGGVLGAFAAIAAARVETLAGLPVHAAAKLRPVYESLAAIGERYFRPLIGALLAQAALADGATEEARAIAGDAEELADPDDTETQVLLRCVRANLCMTDGEPARAFQLAEEALEIADGTEAPVLRADVRASLAEVSTLAGLDEQAARLRAEARSLYAEKGAVSSASLLDPVYRP